MNVISQRATTISRCVFCACVFAVTLESSIAQPVTVDVIVRCIICAGGRRDANVDVLAFEAEEEDVCARRGGYGGEGSSWASG